MTNRATKVLLVEGESKDSEVIMAMLKDSKQSGGLKQFFFHTDIAVTLQEGIKKLHRDKYDVLILDLSLSENRGIDTFLRVRDQSADIPIIVLTERQDEEVALEALSEGAQDYLIKGEFNERLLLHSINYSMERKNFEESLERSNRALRVISECNQLLVRATEESDLMDKICDILVEIGQYTFAWVGFIEHNQKKVIPVAYAGKEKRHLENDKIKWDDSENGGKAFDKSIMAGKTTIWNNAFNGPVFTLWLKEAKEEGYAAVISLPLKVNSNILGVLAIYSSNVNAFASEEVKLLEELADDLAYGIRAIRTRIERGRIQKSLKESEGQLKAIINGSPIPQFVIDKNHRVVYWNRALEKYSGLTSEDMVGTNKQWKAFYNTKRPCMADLLVENDYDGVVKWYPGKYSRSEFVEGAFNATDFFPYLGENGKWLYFTAVAIKNGDNNIIGAVETLEDITARKQAEEALHKSEEKFRALIYNSTDLIRILDKNGMISFDSPSSTRIIGYPEGSLIGKNPLDFIHPDDQEKVKIGLQKVYEKRNSGNLTELRIRKADGTYLPVETVAQNLTHVHGIEGVVVTTHPIEKRKEMEDTLRDSEEYLKKIFSTIQAGIMIIDEKTHTIVDLNEIACNLIGASKEEIVGEKCHQYVCPSSEGKCPISDLNQIVDNDEHILLDVRGRIIPVIKTVVPARLKGRRCFIESFIDITDRKKFENELKTSLKEKEVLIQEIHHRVKNNLQIISSLLNLQKSYVDDEESIDVLKESQNRVMSMAMIHEMLYQSKDLAQISFSGYIQRLVSDLLNSYGVKNTIKLVMNVEEIFLNIETAVPSGLIVSELVSNALKYAVPEGKTGELLVDLHSNNEEFELIISDNGVGFPENLDFRNTKSLGLQLVNSLVDQLDGSIELDRTHGTKFIIKFKEVKYKKRVVNF